MLIQHFECSRDCPFRSIRSPGDECPAQRHSPGCGGTGMAQQLHPTALPGIPQPCQGSLTLGSHSWGCPSSVTGTTHSPEPTALWEQHSWHTASTRTRSHLLDTGSSCHRMSPQEVPSKDSFLSDTPASLPKRTENYFSLKNSTPGS